MPRRVKPIVLIGLIAALILSIALLAGAKTGGGRDAALGTAMGEVGTPYGFGTDGPGSFSCTGLVRHALRSAGVDPNAPWDHMAYLGAYPNVAEPQPGDVVIYPDGAAMYTGGGQVVMANHADGAVGTYGMNEVGTPVGFVNPYGDGATDPAKGGAVDPAMADDPMLDGSLELDPGITGDPVLDGSLELDPGITGEPVLDAGDPVLDGSLAVDPGITGDPALGGSLAVDPAITGDLAAVDPLVP